MSTFVLFLAFNVPIAAAQHDEPTTDDASASSVVTALQATDRASVEVSRLGPRAESAGQGANRLVPQFRITDPTLDALGSSHLAEASPSERAARTIGVVDFFRGLHVGQCCGEGEVVPPSPDLAAGPVHLIEVVNVSFRVFDHIGSSITPLISFESFFAALGPACAGSFDPTVVYDEESDRYLISTNGGLTTMCLAVSDSGDPSGAWTIWAIPAGVGDRAYVSPRLGVGDDGIFVGASMFDPNTTEFVEGRVFAIDKTRLYSGSFSGTTAGVGANFAPQPLHLHGHHQGTWPDLAGHFFVANAAEGDRLRLWRWDEPLNGGQLTVDRSFDLAAATGIEARPPVVAKQRGGPGITGGDNRFRDFEFRNGSGWTTQTIGCLAGNRVTDCIP